MTWRVEKIRVQGVKGVLTASGEFKLKGGRSIAIFAPNACGKSGYADALEYFFSADGLVEHLGKGGSDSERGGKHAIPHILASERGIEPSISVSLRETDESGRTLSNVEVTRPVRTGRADELPAFLRGIVAAAPAQRILRQHDLRRFVVDLEPRGKYAEFARWVGLERLEQVLTHLTTAGNALDRQDLDREIAERKVTLRQQTNASISDEAMEEEVFRWCTTAGKSLLKEEVLLDKLEDLAPLSQRLRERRDSITLASRDVSEKEKAKVRLRNAHEVLSSPETGISATRHALSAALAAGREAVRVAAAAKQIVFQRVWQESEKVLAELEVSVCPVCQTPWERGQAGTQKVALQFLSEALESLAEVRGAEKNAHEAAARVSRKVAALVDRTSVLTSDLATLGLGKAKDSVPDLSAQKGRLTKPDSNQATWGDDVTTCLDELESFLVKHLEPIVSSLPDAALPIEAAPFDALAQKFGIVQDSLRRLKDLQARRESFQAVRDSFRKVAGLIQNETAGLLKRIVDSLRDEVNRVYKKIHPASKIPIVHIDPDTETKSLLLRVDFHEKGRTVPPAGYLSESQINTLGISLFISAVRLFNSSFPLVVLDDIVSSYDADHRARIADVVAEDLSRFQVLLTTHDELFYQILRARLQDAGWLFDRISSWSLDAGPKREEDTIDLRRVNELIKEGDPQAAGNAVRQHMEAWLDRICEQYDVLTVHRRGTREFRRTLYDFWEPFLHRCKTIKNDFFTTRLEPAPSYQRLKSHNLLNYYSHAQSDPYSWGSIGDVVYVRDEFTDFTRLFLCSSCGKNLKYHRDSHALFCTCGGGIFPRALQRDES
jgi:hypothetical protein